MSFREKSVYQMEIKLTEKLIASNQYLIEKDYTLLEFYLVKNLFQIDHILFYFFKKYIQKPKSPFFSSKFA